MNTEHNKILLAGARLNLTIERLCHQLIEDWSGLTDICLVGIQPRGAALAERLYRHLKTLPDLPKIDYGKLDITFYRDDLMMHDTPLSPHPNDMPFIVTNRRVVLVDDVLYTGRTIQAALAALQHYGRPQKVDLLVLVDRRFNRHLPIKADYAGIRVDSVDAAYVRVRWAELHGEDGVMLFDKK